MMAQLIYADVSSITYRTEDIILRLTPEQQSLVIQALAVYNDSDEWQDYETYSDEIDALVAASEYALQTDDTSQVILPTISLFSINASASGGGLTYTQAAFMPFGYSMDTDTTANRYIQHNVWLPAGTIEYTWQYAKTTASGNADLLLTSVSGSIVETFQNNIDLYGLFNARFATGGQINVPASDFYQIRVANDGTKNALSSGYRMSSTSFHLRQIA